MKKVISFFVVIMIAQLSFSQGLVKGSVVDKTTNEALVGVSVINPASGAGVATALDGSFAIKVPAGKQELKISYIGYTTKTIQVTYENYKLGNIELESQSIGLSDVTVTSSIAIRRKTPVALSVIDPITIETKMGSQEFPEILKSTPGVYATKQGGGYGDSRVNVRGFENVNVATMINGIPMNDMENGSVYWSNWGSLSDVTRDFQLQRGLGASKVAAPSLGGSLNVVTRSTDVQKGGSVSYSLNDGSTKIGFSVSTGLTADNWAITLIGSKESGSKNFQGGEFEAYSYFVNISKRISDSQLLSFNAFAAPQWHNQRYSGGLLISEWQKQPIKYKYNAAYGFDMNGQRKLNSYYNYYNKPQISLNHFWTIDEKSSLSTAVYVSLGHGGGWSGQANADGNRNNWNSSTSTGQVSPLYRAADGTFDYGAIYALNTDPTYTGGSRMVMSSSTNDHFWIGALSTYTTKIGQNIDVYGGLDLRYYKGTHQNRIVDLYGGPFFIDNTSLRPLLTDQSWKTKKLGVGNIVYRDYDGLVSSEGLFGQAEYNKDKLSTFISLSASNTSNQRYDRFYYDPANAFSKSISFLGYTVKGGANYNIDQYQNVFGNIGIISRAPFFTSIFTNSAVSNTINAKAINEKAFSAELGYGFRSKYFTANLNVYRTNWLDKSTVTSIATQSEVLTVNLQGVNALHQGVELDFKSKPMRDLEFTGMISLGDWRWQNNAKGYIFNSNGQPTDQRGNVKSTPDSVQVNIKGIPVGNSAQTTAAIGLSYQILKGFRIGLDGNYFGRNYSYYSITNAVGVNNISQPWMIPDAVTFDLNANYYFKIREFDAVLIGNINNLLDSEYITDARDGGDHTWKTAMVMYGWGRTFSMNLKIKF
jgi:hypothetical protein